MVFVFGISSGLKQIEYYKTKICSQCGKYGRYEVFMSFQYLSIFLIPILKWNRKYFVKTTCCSAVYELSKEKGERLLHHEGSEISESDLVLVQEGIKDYSKYMQSCAFCGYKTQESFVYCPKCGVKY